MYTYIVIDDESIIRKGIIKKLSSLENMLTCIGEVSNGQEALALIETENPDIIITDMHMPILDGTQLLPLLAEKYQDKPIIVISGYKDFDYMKHAINAQAIDYLLKPFSKEDLQKALLKAIERLQNHQKIQQQLITQEKEKEISNQKYDKQLLKNLILGHQTQDFTFTSEKINFVNKNYHFLLVTLSSKNTLNETILETFLSENSFGDLALYLPHLNCEYLGFLMLFLPKQSILPPKELTRQVLTALNNFLISQNIFSIMGISQVHHDLLTLNAAYIETINALNQRHILDHSSVFFYSTPDHSNDNQNPFCWNDVQEFLFRIESGEAEKSVSMLKELFLYFQTCSCNLGVVKNYCFWLSNQTKLLLQEYLPHMISDQSQSMLSSLDTMFFIEEIQSYYQQFFFNICSLFKNINVYATDDIVEKMKLYVDRHFRNNLTIELLSCLFYLNRSYCSHLFKQRAGISFVDYLNRQRLAYAKMLLKTTNKKMSQIARSSGYDNEKYFYRVFKKYEKITPEQYRNNS